MTVDTMIVAVIGLGCVLYLGNKVRNMAKGESGCSSCSGCPSVKTGCCGKSPDQK